MCLGCSALTTVILPNVSVIEPGAFDGDLNLNCAVSKYQPNVTSLIQSSCTSTASCAPLSGCPIQMQYTFSNDTVSGSMVANIANSFLDFDATLRNGATANSNRLVLRSIDQQFMEIADFSLGIEYHTTIAFGFNSVSVGSGTICEFSSGAADIFRMYLSPDATGAGLILTVFSFRGKNSSVSVEGLGCC